jgi:ferric-dicitrate binding protein FerR (iron transport regulator)
MNFGLYKKMLRGECTPEEADLVMQWLQNDPAAFEKAMLEEVSSQEQYPMPKAIRQQMLAWFEAKSIPASHVAPVVDIRPVAIRKKNWYKWAAAAVLLITITAWWLYPSKKKEHGLAWREIRNGSKSVKLVILPDSTTIWLNNFAVLRYHEDFYAQQKREVKLTGEAYFKVAHNKKRPFIVITENLTTRVLGTEFNVEAYPDEEFIKVTLDKGRVQVKSLDTTNGQLQQQQVLNPGQMATYDKTSAALTVRNSPSKNTDAWTREGLVLNDVPLQDALNRIGRRYNRVIQFDSVRVHKYRHITAYYRSLSIEQVLTQLGFTCNFNISKTADGFRIILK